MKRLLSIVLVVLLGAAAWAMPSPEREGIDQLPDDVEVLVAEPVEEPPAPRFAECPWAVSDDLTDTRFAVTSLTDATVTLTFPAAGEVKASAEQTVPSQGAVLYRLSTSLRQGLAPAVLEFTDGPAGAAVLVEGPEGVAGDACTAVSPKVWMLPGGSTKRGDRLELQLFNPFPDDARLDVLVTSEIGVEQQAALQAISVPAQSSTTIALHDVIPLRDTLSVSVEIAEGLVIPAMAWSSEGGDSAVWTGRPQAEEWELPLTRVGRLDGSIVISNDGRVPVGYEIDLFTQNGPRRAALQGIVEATNHVNLPIADIGGGLFGARVRGDGPLGVAVTGESDTARAATVGASTTATEWLLPGLGADGSATNLLWLLNTGNEPITVTYQGLDATGPAGASDKVIVAAGTIQRVVVEGELSGLLAQSTRPFSAAWSSTLRGTAVYSAGVPVVE